MNPLCAHSHSHCHWERHFQMHISCIHTVTLHANSLQRTSFDHFKKWRLSTFSKFHGSLMWSVFPCDGPSFTCGPPLWQTHCTTLSHSLLDTWILALKLQNICAQCNANLEFSEVQLVSMSTSRMTMKTMRVKTCIFSLLLWTAKTFVTVEVTPIMHDPCVL